MLREKTFSIAALLSVTTGTLLTPSFGDVHEVFDHLYPGIMTLGVALMADKAAARVLEQHPELAGVEPPDFGDCYGEEYMEALRPWMDRQVRKFGATLLLMSDPMRETPAQNGVGG